MKFFDLLNKKNAVDIQPMEEQFEALVERKNYLEEQRATNEINLEIEQIEQKMEQVVQLIIEHAENQ